MGTLIDSPNIPDPDGFYAELLDVHAGLTEPQSHALNARLVLILCNQIGDRNVLAQALHLAADTARGASNET